MHVSKYAPKHVAGGFILDADKLLKDFVGRDSKDFKTFCGVWKKHNFSYIFMGRPDEKELREFVNETYHLTLNYMMAASIEFQIGAVYLLYALYRNQNIVAPIKIRVNRTQFLIFQRIQGHAEQQKMRSLHYVIEYLFTNCLELVASSYLYGPTTKVNYIKPRSDEFGILTGLKQNMSALQECNVLETLKTMHSQYLREKESIQHGKNITMDATKQYEQFSEGLDNLIGGNKSTNDKKLKSDIVSGGIGSRRLKLKNASFQRKAVFRVLNPDEDVDDPTLNALPFKRYLRKRRPPPQKRRMGRPRKKRSKPATSEDSEIEDNTPDIKIKTASTGRKRGRPVGRNTVSYLEKHDGPSLPEIKKPAKIVYDVSSSCEDSSGDVRF